MTSHNKITLVLIFFLVGFSSSVSAVILNWDTITLYDDASFTFNRPNVYNGHVAYSGRYGEILYWDGVDTIQVNAIGGTAPSLHNGNIAWYGGVYDIYLWNGEQVSQLTNSFINGFPSIWENTVTWQTGYVNAKDNQDIYYFDGTITHQISSTVGTEFYDGYPSLWYGKIAWARGSSLESQILFWDGANILELTALSDDDHLPSLYDGTIAFSRGSDQNSHIMFWDGTTVSEIAQYTSYMNVEPRVALWKDMIVWPGYDGHDTEIFLWDGYEVHQVTDNDVWEYDPDICIQGRQIQITYVETDNINENVLTRVKYVTAYFDPSGQVPEPSQIVFALSCIPIFILFAYRNKNSRLSV
jgi:hypothetical protein